MAVDQTVGGDAIRIEHNSHHDGAGLHMKWKAVMSKIIDGQMWLTETLVGFEVEQASTIGRSPDFKSLY